MTDISKEAAERMAETLRGEHGFAFIGCHAIEAASMIDALSARVAELESVVGKIEYWLDTDAEILDSMPHDERRDHLEKLDMVRSVIVSQASGASK